jgi:hypothetical protein
VEGDWDMRSEEHSTEDGVVGLLGDGAPDAGIGIDIGGWEDGRGAWDCVCGCDFAA